MITTALIISAAAPIITTVAMLPVVGQEKTLEIAGECAKQSIAIEGLVQFTFGSTFSYTEARMSSNYVSCSIRKTALEYFDTTSEDNPYKVAAVAIGAGAIGGVYKYTMPKYLLDMGPTLMYAIKGAYNNAAYTLVTAFDDSIPEPIAAVSPAAIEALENADCGIADMKDGVKLGTTILFCTQNALPAVSKTANFIAHSIAEAIHLTGESVDSDANDEL